MSANVFMARCDPEHFDRTVRSEVDLSERTDYPDELSEMDTVRFYGAPEGTSNQRNFEKMESGDLVLFHSDGEYVGSGRIGTTFEDEPQWASTTFWDDELSDRIYTITDFQQASVPKERVNKIFGYDGGYNPQDLLRVAEKRVTHSSEAIELALQKYTEKHG